MPLDDALMASIILIHLIRLLIDYKNAFSCISLNLFYDYLQLIERIWQKKYKSKKVQDLYQFHDFPTLIFDNSLNNFQ